MMVAKRYNEANRRMKKSPFELLMSAKWSRFGLPMAIDGMPRVKTQ
jgi:hypothetical protein